MAVVRIGPNGAGVGRGDAGQVDAAAVEGAHGGVGVAVFAHALDGSTDGVGDALGGPANGEGQSSRGGLSGELGAVEFGWVDERGGGGHGGLLFSLLLLLLLAVELQKGAEHADSAGVRLGLFQTVAGPSAFFKRRGAGEGILQCVGVDAVWVSRG